MASREVTVNLMNLDSVKRLIERADAEIQHLRAEVERLHHYTSTACWHGRHARCGEAQHDRGEDGQPHCKWCPEPCQCVCHREVPDVG